MGEQMRDYCKGLSDIQRDAVVEMLVRRRMAGQEASFEGSYAQRMIDSMHRMNSEQAYAEHLLKLRQN